MAANTHSLLFYPGGTRTIPHQTYNNFGSGSYTISFWFKKNSTPAAAAPLFHKVNSGSNWPLTVRINTSGTLTCQQYNGSTNPLWSTTTNVCDGSWHYITIILNDSTTNRIGVDGTQEGTATHLGVTTTNGITLNADSDPNTAAGFYIDSLVIYDAVVSISTAYGRRVDDHSAQGYSNLQGEYELDNNANDSSSNSNNMTGTGGYFSKTVAWGSTETLDQQFNPTSDNQLILRFGASNQVLVAQQFTPAQSGYVSRVVLELAKNNSPTGNVWAEIYSDTGSNLPNAQIGSDSDTVDVTTITDSSTPGQLVDFTFSSQDTTVTATTKYWIVLNGDYTASGTVNVAWDILDAGGYTGGITATYNGSSWTSNSTRDHWFDQYYDVASTSILDLTSNYW